MMKSSRNRRARFRNSLLHAKNCLIDANKVVFVSARAASEIYPILSRT